MELILPAKQDTTESITINTKVLVVIGANGAGKSSFGRALQKQYKEKSLFVSGMHALFIDSDEKEISTEGYELSHLQSIVAKRIFMPKISEYEKLILRLQEEEFETAVKFKEDSKQTKDLTPPITKIDVIQGIWERMFTHNRLVHKSGFIEIISTNRNSDSYKAGRMSDGEKIVFYLIGAALYAPKDALLIIEEPEILLHDSIKNQLWNEIEALRPDCTFVYLTHVKISFTANDQSLNRRDDLFYTLLVPDRARTLFPCFDQPDMKALFTLTLEVPATWKVVANGAVERIDSISSPGRRCFYFHETEPLSTYLFSFVGGNLQQQTFSRNGRQISMFHRETDPKKIAQCPDIANEVFDALEWMEHYTDAPYPFAKYDFIVLPGFQFGGMEHTGATLYNDNSIFLNENPTLDERLRRSTLIAHETAHMWFGDDVTMAWFNDVWTKEVFANYFALRIVEPQYKEINHRLNFLLNYYPSAYAEDRTAGTTPVKQQLDNLNNAGLVYGNIIYDKSPVIMNMLVRIMGEENFRSGLQEYMKKYAYNNATWDDLIDILSKHTHKDLKTWSHVWINEKGMPEIICKMANDTLILSQKDNWNRRLS